MVAGSAAGAGGAASFGPVLFFGLTAVALISHTDDTPPLPNPAETMEFSADAEAAVLLTDVTPLAPEVAFSQPERLEIVRLAGLAEPTRPSATSFIAAPLDFPAPPSDAFFAPAASTAPDATSVAVTFSLGPGVPGRKQRPSDLARESEPELGLQPVAWPAPLELARPLVVRQVAPFSDVSMETHDSDLREISGAQIPSFERLSPISAPALDLDLKGVPSLIWAGVTGFFVNVRRGPGLEFESLDQLNPGARVIMTDAQDGWARIGVIRGGDAPLIGWMSTDFLEVEVR